VLTLAALAALAVGGAAGVVAVRRAGLRVAVRGAVSRADVRGAGSGVVVSARYLHLRGIQRGLPAAVRIYGQAGRDFVAAAAARERGVTPNDG